MDFVTPDAELREHNACHLPGGSSEGGQFGAKAQCSITAYHGSPYTFDAFDASKIGTGEGAQSYGYGLYFAENPRVAQEYKENVIDVSRFDAINKRLSALATEMDQHRAGEYGKFKTQRGYDLSAEYDALMQERANIKGKMYEVAIHAASDEFLDWDKPLSQQSDKVKKALADLVSDDVAGSDIYGEIGDRLAAKRYGSPTTAIYARNTTGEGTKRQVEATEELKKLGIKGIRYLDQGSRGETIVTHKGRLMRGFGSEAEAHKAMASLPATIEPKVVKMPYGEEWAVVDRKANTFNYVVFDPKVVRIVNVKEVEK